MSEWKYDLRGAIGKEVQKAVDDIVKQKNNAMAMEFTRVICDLLKENGVMVQMAETEEENHATNKFEIKYGVRFTGIDFSEHDKKVTEEKDNRIEDLESYHQYASLEINKLNVALEVMTEKYMKLREVHGL